MLQVKIGGKKKKANSLPKCPGEKFFPKPKFGKNLNAVKITIARFLISLSPETIWEVAWLWLAHKSRSGKY